MSSGAIVDLIVNKIKNPVNYRLVDIVIKSGRLYIIIVVIYIVFMGFIKLKQKKSKSD